jgi:hypothetical protein
MSKEALKTTVTERQDGVDAIVGLPLPDDTSLYDSDRITPKAEGGTYNNLDNVRTLLPETHMERHGTLRTRDEQLEMLKSTFDDRVQTMKLLMKVNNQLLAYARRTDHRHPETEAWLNAQTAPFEQRLAMIDKSLTKQIKTFDDPVAKAALRVKGLGPVTVAALSVYIDLNKAACPSSLWKYCGLDKASHERYTKGEASGGNKTLRTVLWNAACVMMKLGEGPYRAVYDQTKGRLEVSEKMTKSRNTQGKLIEVAWKDTKPCHRHGAALRAVMKHILADYWRTGRELLGLPTVPVYAEAMLGHTHIVPPSERGWSTLKVVEKDKDAFGVDDLPEPRM